MDEKVKQAFSTLWAEAIRLNCGMAYEKVHEVLNLLEDAEANKGSEKDSKIIIIRSVDS
jgi:hypothetical protein